MPNSTPVRQIMTTEVVSFTPDENVRDAVGRLTNAGVDAGPVLDADGGVVGMLSSGDLIVQETQVHLPTVVTLLGAYLELPGEHKRFEADLAKTLGSTVAEVMAGEPVTCGPDDTVETAATLMHRHDVSRLPVIEDGRLVGLVARGDILRVLIADLDG